MLAIARAGLKTHAHADASGHDETVYLDPLDATAGEGMTVADQLLALYEGSWGGQVAPVFEAMTYDRPARPAPAPPLAGHALGA